MNINETKAVLRILEESFQDFKPSDETASVWAAVLADLPASDAKKAALEVCRTDTKAPCPSRILAVARGQNEGYDEPPSMIWERIVQLAANGERGKAIFDTHESPRTRSAVYSIGGFNYLRRAEVSQLPFIRRDFLTAYQDRQTYEVRKIESQKVIDLVNLVAEKKQIKDGGKNDD